MVNLNFGIIFFLQLKQRMQIEENLQTVRQALHCIANIYSACVASCFG